MKKCKLLVINKLGSRTYSLDLLRIIAMMMVLVLHTNLFGGFLKINSNDSYELCIDLYEHLSIVAVDSIYYNKCMVFKIKVYIFFKSLNLIWTIMILDCGYVISRGTTWRTNNISGYS